MAGPVKTLVALLLLAAGTSRAAAPDFDQGVAVRPALEQARENAGLSDQKAARPEGVEGLEDAVWISVADEDAAALGTESGFPGREVVAAGGGVSVYQARIAELPRLADRMHEKLHKCGGFFTFRTLAAARLALAAVPGAAAAREYSIDQGDRVRPMVAAIDEASLGRVINQLAAYKNRYYTADTGVASARWVADHWKSLAGGRSDISVELYPHKGWAQESVILTMRGTESPDSVVVLGGHLDSIAGWGGDSAVAPGADDNGSGIAVLAEAIRVAVRTGYRPARTVKFIGYAAEEVGLRGSRDIAEAFQGAGVDVQGVIQFDMTAFRGSAEDILLISDYTDQAQNAFLGRLIDEYTDLRWGTTACGYACSDHASWNALGIPASLPFEAKFDEDNPNIHSARDTLAQIGGKADHAVGFARLAAAYLAEMGK